MNKPDQALRFYCFKALESAYEIVKFHVRNVAFEQKLDNSDSRSNQIQLWLLY